MRLRAVRMCLRGAKSSLRRSGFRSCADHGSDYRRPDPNLPVNRLAWENQVAELAQRSRFLACRVEGIVKTWECLCR